MPDPSSFVFVLNSTTEAIDLRVNNFSAGVVPAGKLDPTTGFVLGVLKVPRSSAPAPGAAIFGSGKGSNANTMEVASPGQDILYNGIEIDPAVYRLNVNLQMYVFYSAAVLCSAGITIWGKFDPDAAVHPAHIHATHELARA
jgi:hypothetical protein